MLLGVIELVVGRIFCLHKVARSYREELKVANVELYHWV